MSENKELVDQLAKAFSDTVDANWNRFPNRDETLQLLAELKVKIFDDFQFPLYVQHPLVEIDQQDKAERKAQLDNEYKEYCKKVDDNPETVLCGHLDRIKEDMDAYHISCSDGAIDICTGCVEKSDHTKIIYIPDADEDDFNGEGQEKLKFNEDGAVHPNWTDGVDEWNDYVEWAFQGTKAELKAYLDTINKD